MATIEVTDGDSWEVCDGDSWEVRKLLIMAETTLSLFTAISPYVSPPVTFFLLTHI